MNPNNLSVSEINKSLDIYLNSAFNQNKLAKIKQKILANKPQIDAFLKDRKA